jgi:protein-L-isoaspartate(D-aspartate) O-methyltransferase
MCYVNLKLAVTVAIVVCYVFGSWGVVTAWRSSGSSNTELVDNLQANGVIENPRVAAAMKAVDRGLFSRNNPYMDAPQSIGYAVTISAPHMHAHALELLADKLTDGAKVLDVGSGSGYLTACMALMVGKTGVAVGIEHINELVELSITNVNKDPSLAAILDSGRLQFVVGDGRQGYEPLAPYDAIHVGAAAPEIPQPLVDQLKPGGRLIVPVDQPGHRRGQTLIQVDKLTNGTAVSRELMDVIFVPLTSKQQQWPRAEPENIDLKTPNSMPCCATAHGRVRNIGDGATIASSMLTAVMISRGLGYVCEQ